MPQSNGVERAYNYVDKPPENPAVLFHRRMGHMTVPRMIQAFKDGGDHGIEWLTLKAIRDMPWCVCVWILLPLGFAPNHRGGGAHSPPSLFTLSLCLSACLLLLQVLLTQGPQGARGAKGREAVLTEVCVLVWCVCCCCLSVG